MSTASAIDFPPEELARLARLRYVLDEDPGFQRHLNGKGFVYINGHGKPLSNQRQLDRIERLAIPPAWSEVWICRHPDGHLQATGRDARGRKQYIYHQQWRDISNAAKFFRLKACPRFLPKLRLQVSRDMRGRSLTKTRVVAGMVALLDLTSIRIGNEEYVRENGSYGLATLRNRHVTIQDKKALLRFRAKSGLFRETEVSDQRLVRLLKELKKLRGAHVFQYRDEAGAIHSADSIAVNTYLHERTSHRFTAKDFRTWKASALTAGILFDERAVEILSLRKQVVKRAVGAVSETLGNTPTVCRKYYIHAGLFEAYLQGGFHTTFQRYRPADSRALSRDEQILSRFLRTS